MVSVGSSFLVEAIDDVRQPEDRRRSAVPATSTGYSKHNGQYPPAPCGSMLYGRNGALPPGWRVSWTNDAVRIVDGTDAVVLEATRTGSVRWRLVCRATAEGAEFVDEFGTVPSKGAALTVLESAAWIVHHNGIDPEHVGVSLEREGLDVRWRGWKFE